MTTGDRFRWAVEVSEAELLAEAGRAFGMTDGEVQMAEQNILLYPRMVASLRRIGLQDAYIARAMLDPHGFADEVLEDSQHPERWDRPPK